LTVIKTKIGPSTNNKITLNTSIAGKLTVYYTIDPATNNNTAFLKQMSSNKDIFTQA